MAKRQNHGNNHGHNNHGGHNQDHGNSHGGGHGNNSNDSKKDDKKQGGNDKYTTVTFLKDSAWNSLQSLFEAKMGSLAAVLTGTAVAGTHANPHHAATGHNTALTDLANGPIATAVGKGAEFLAEKAGVSPQTAERVRELFEESAADLTKAIANAGPNASQEDINKILTKQLVTKARLFKVEMKGATPILHTSDCEEVPRAASRTLEEIKAAYTGKHVLLPKRCCGEFAKFEMKKIEDAAAAKPAKPPFPKSLLSKLQWMKDFDAEVKAEAAKDGNNRFKTATRWFVGIAQKAKAGDHESEEQLRFLNSELKEDGEIKFIILEEDDKMREGMLQLAVEKGKIDALHHLAADLLDVEKAAHELEIWAHEIGAEGHTHHTAPASHATPTDLHRAEPPVLTVADADIAHETVVTPDPSDVIIPQPPSLPPFELKKLQIVAVTDSSFTIEFEGLRDCTAVIKYRENNSSERWKLFPYVSSATLHSVTIDGLTKDKEYLFQVTVKDDYTDVEVNAGKEIPVKITAPVAGATFRPEIIEVPKPKAPEPKKEDGWFMRGLKGLKETAKLLFS